MTAYYLRSTDGDDASDGLSWANARATMISAVSLLSAGDTLYVSQSHSEASAGNKTVSVPGTDASPCRILCVDDSAEPPTTLSTGADVGATGATYQLANGFAYVYGMTLKGAFVRICGSGRNGWVLDNCILDSTLASAGGGFYLGALSSNSYHIELINTQFNFKTTAHVLTMNQDAIVRDCSDMLVANSAVPATLFDMGTGAGINRTICYMRNVNMEDLSGTLVVGNSDIRGGFIFESCRVHANTVKVSGDTAFGGIYSRFVNCDSGDTNYTYSLARHPGTISHETTIVLANGATDGTTSFSREMVTGAGAKFFHPLESDWMVLFNNTSGAELTATVEVVTDNTTLTDAEAWLEVEYMASETTCLATLLSDRAANVLANAANQTSSNASWNTTGLATPVTQKLSVAFTPNQKGVVRSRVCLARANTTMYFDPRVTLA